MLDQVKMLLKTLIDLGIVLILITIAVNLMKRSTLFFPERYPAGVWDPDRYVVRPTDLWIPTPDDLLLHAWLFTASDPNAPLLIFCHGNGGNLTSRADTASRFASRGVSVLVFDYRGYGRSQGKPTENELYTDALAVRDYVQTKDLATAGQIVMYGESLGGPYAASVAARRTVRCVIIDSSFPSAASVANAIYHVPVGLFLGHSLPTAKFLNQAAVPVLVMHGRSDHTIPFRCGKELYDRLKGPREMFVSEDADHCELAWTAGYYDRVIGFIQKAGQPRRSPQ